MKISTFVKISVLAIFISAGWNLCAKSEEMGFLTGSVLAAEISTVPTEIIDLEKSPLSKYESPAYAIVVVKMYHNRSISQLDYNLVINGENVPCIAAAYNMDTFVINSDMAGSDARKAALFPSESDYVRLLFMFDRSKLKLNAPVISATLKSNLNGRKSIQIKLNNLGDGNFTDVKTIPANGILK